MKETTSTPRLPRALKTTKIAVAAPRPLLGTDNVCASPAAGPSSCSAKRRIIPDVSIPEFSGHHHHEMPNSIAFPEFRNKKEELQSGDELVAALQISRHQGKLMLTRNPLVPMAFFVIDSNMAIPMNIQILANDDPWAGQREYNKILQHGPIGAANHIAWVYSKNYNPSVPKSSL